MKLYFTRFSFQLLLSCMPFYFFLTLSESTIFAAGGHGEASNRYRCIVKSPSGTYRGLFNASVLNPHCKYCSYRDVPYGEPPLGNRRFGMSVLRKPLPSDVIYDATQDKRQCPQTNVTASEDCLYLNIYTPYDTENLNSSSFLPVIVWVHGGGYYSGSKTSLQYSPDYFMPRKVVLVTINYRLGAFGYLNLNISEAPGNQGMRDQLLALEWIQKNIRSFGGDPKRVTSMGESSGGSAVTLQLLSPRFQGFINRVIVESGLAPVLPQNYGNESIDFAVFLGYKGNINDRHKILCYLQGLDITRLVNGYTSYQNKTGLIRALAPTRDDAGPDPLFPASVEYLSAKAPNIPCIMGYNSADGTGPFGGNPYIIVNETLSTLGTLLATYVDPVFAKDNQTMEKVVEKVKAYFYNPRDKNSQLDKTVKLLTILFSYKFYDLVRTSRASYVNKNVWTYYFDYGGGYSYAKNSSIGSAYAGEVHGAAHGEDLSYLFYTPKYSPNGFQATERELRLIERMTTWWTNLARTGSPNSNCDSIGVDWYPATPSQNNYLWIRNSSEPVLVKNREINQKLRDFFHYLREFARNY